MTPCDFLVPYSLAEAIDCLDAEDPGVRPVAGGTAVWLMMKAGVLRPTRLVSLQHIGPSHSRVAVAADGSLTIGGTTVLSALEHDASVRRGWPVVLRTLKSLSNVRVRAVATIGGNLAHADPHMDLPPVLAALGAHVEVTGPRGCRTMSIEDLCVGYYETALARDELISKVVVPPQRGPAAYTKVTTRAAHDWPAVALAVSLTMSGSTIASSSIVVGAATDRPTRLVAAQAALDGTDADDACLARAAAAASAEIEIVGDAHGSADYKRHLLGVHLVRTVRQILPVREH